MHDSPPPRLLVEQVQASLKRAMRAREFDPADFTDRKTVAERVGLSESGLRHALGVRIDPAKLTMPNLWTVIRIANSLGMSSIDRLLGPTPLMSLNDRKLLPDPGMYHDTDTTWGTLG